MALALSTFDISPEEYRRRAAWAQAQGKPQWLWPDISVEHLESARATIVGVLGDVLARGTSETILEGDPETISLAAYTAGIGPLLGWWIAQGRINASAQIAAVLELHLRHNILRMETMRDRTIEILRSLAHLGIAATVLKGMHTAFSYFPDPATRPASDIDLLVAPEDARSADRHFRDSGFMVRHRSAYETSWGVSDIPSQPSSLLLTHANDPLTVDLHRSLDSRPYPALPAARLDMVARASRPAPWPVDPVGRVLPQPALLLHLAVHAGYAMQSLTPLRMAEIALVIRRDTAPGILRWDAFLDAARQAKALGIILPALYFTERLVPGTVPENVLDAAAAAAPTAVRRHLLQFTPATVQAIDRTSLSERFMWSEGWPALCRRVAYGVLPSTSPRFLGQYYRRWATLFLTRRWSR